MSRGDAHIHPAYRTSGSDVDHTTEIECVSLFGQYIVGNIDAVTTHTSLLDRARSEQAAGHYTAAEVCSRMALTVVQRR